MSGHRAMPAPPTVDDLADQALAACAGGRLAVLVDGRSGAGKSTLAARLAGTLAGRGGQPVQLVSLDDVYPGWDGLAAAGRAVWQTILRPGRPGYWRYDWGLGRTDRWVPLDPQAPILVEGCGALTPASARLAGWRLWLDGDEAGRRTRVRAREGASYESWWERWAAQERAHLAAHDPARLADLVLDAGQVPPGGGSHQAGGSLPSWTG